MTLNRVFFRLAALFVVAIARYDSSSRLARRKKYRFPCHVIKGNWYKSPSKKQALKNQVAQERERDERSEKTTFGIVDAQSVKNADTAQEKGYDAGKKVSGIKRHLTVDTNGLPHAIHITFVSLGDARGCNTSIKIKFV